MPAIPAWVYTALSIAFKIGSPYLVRAIKNLAAKYLSPEALKIIQDFLDGIKNPFVPNGAVKNVARRAWDEHCVGGMCVPTLKKD